MHVKEILYNRILMRAGIASAAFLISWLSGGFPPLIWMALFQAVSRASYTGSYLSAPQSGSFSPLFILGAQSLCLLLAWGVLLWLIVREVIFVSPTLQRHQSAGISRAGNVAGIPLDDEPTMQFTLATGVEKAGIPLEERELPLSAHGALTLPIARGDKFETWLELPVEPLTSFSERRDELKTVITDVRARLPIEPVLLPNGYEGPRIHAQTHTGIVRAGKPNEDSYLQLAVMRQPLHSSPQWAGLFLVADGMGGHEHGKYASSLVVDAIGSDLDAYLRDPRQSSEDLKQHFVTAVKRANERLFRENTDADTFRGTTLTGVILLEEAARDECTGTTTTHVAHVVNVGDSRTYWHSIARGFQRVTQDHSTVENLIALRLISPEERYTHKKRNEIYRCLGEKEDIEVDLFTLALQPRDRLLLCSDGLWEMVRDGELASLVAKSTERPSYITTDLIRAALAQGGKDNVTALVIMIPGNNRG